MKLSEFIEGCERASSYTNEVDIHALISDLKKINESQKVTIPKFIGDWIFKAKLVDRRSISSALETATIRLYAENSDEVIAWLKDISNQDTFAGAWANDYTVEEEPKYTVKVKGKIGENLLVYGWGIKRYFFARTYNNSLKRGEHTRKELEEDGFGWVFDCPGIDIEEVGK